MQKNERNALVWIIVIIALITFFTARGHNFQKTISRDDAISEHWDEIKDNINGTETINACSRQNDNCYDLDADISDGVIGRVYFTNGGYLDFGADIDESGEALDFDKNGNEWDFTVDMDSSAVDDAINSWADSNGYIIK